MKATLFSYNIITVRKSYNYVFTIKGANTACLTKTKLFTYLGITIKQCSNRSVNYNYINKHYTYADSIYYCGVCIMSQNLP